MPTPPETFKQYIERQPDSSNRTHALQVFNNRNNALRSAISNGDFLIPGQGVEAVGGWPAVETLSNWKDPSLFEQYFPNGGQDSILLDFFNSFKTEHNL